MGMNNLKLRDIVLMFVITAVFFGLFFVASSFNLASQLAALISE